MPGGKRQAAQGTDLHVNIDHDRLQAKIARLEQRKRDLLEAGDAAKSRLSFLQDSDSDLRLYSGFPNLTAFTTFFHFLEAGPHGANLLAHCAPHDPPSRAPDDPPGRLSALSLENELLLTLSKLRLGLSHHDLAFRFGLEVLQVQHVFQAWLGLINQRLTGVNLWLPKTDVTRAVPESFKPHFKNTRTIFHELELNTVQTSDWNFSDLNCIITKKLTLLGFAPSGKITYISQLYGEKTSRAAACVAGVPFEGSDTYMTTLTLTQPSPRQHNPDFLQTQQVSGSRAETKLEIDFWNIVNRIGEFQILDRDLPEDEAEMILNVCCRLLNSLD